MMLSTFAEIIMTARMKIRRIRYFLFSAEDAQHRWNNLLIVCELLFSLPFTIRSGSDRFLILRSSNPSERAGFALAHLMI